MIGIEDIDALFAKTLMLLILLATVSKLWRWLPITTIN
jgi:hypothetical protein